MLYTPTTSVASEAYLRSVQPAIAAASSLRLYNSMNLLPLYTLLPHNSFSTTLPSPAPGFGSGSGSGSGAVCSISPVASPLASPGVGTAYANSPSPFGTRENEASLFSGNDFSAKGVASSPRIKLSTTSPSAFTSSNFTSFFAERPALKPFFGSVWSASKTR